MSYINKHKHHSAGRSTEDTSSPMVKLIDNGATASFAFPCFYREVHHPHKAAIHSKRLHDHYGFPSPSYPDGICQEEGLLMEMLHSDIPCNNPKNIRSLLDVSTLIPIHLIAEGYTGVIVSFSETIPGLTVSKAWIDPNKDWIVRTILSAEVPSAIMKKVETMFQVRVYRSDEFDNEIKDVVCKGKLIVVPGPISE